MQPVSTLLFAPVDSTNRDRILTARIEKSEIYRDYKKAFEATTGLPLAIRTGGAFEPPLHGSQCSSPFCALLAARSKSCAACLQLQQCVETKAQKKDATLECFAGLTESAIPIFVGERVVAFLQTGQVLSQKPSEAEFSRTLRLLGDWGTKADIALLKKAYFQTRVVRKAPYESILRLLSIFARHLSALSNQLMILESGVESPVVSKARAFIIEHMGELLSLSQVAQSVNMSTFYFCKTFKKETGLTFTEYVARLRVEAVKNLLLNSHKRVSEAAFEVGFQSLSQFNRVFHSIVGESPSVYRDRLHRSAGLEFSHGARIARAG